MRITFRYMAQLKVAAGLAEETIEVAAPASIQELLGQLAARHEDAYRRILFDDRGEVHPAMLIFLGNEQVQPNGRREFRDGDVITVMAPMAGG